MYLKCCLRILTNLWNHETTISDMVPKRLHSIFISVSFHYNTWTLCPPLLFLHLQSMYKLKVSHHITSNSHSDVLVEHNEVLVTDITARYLTNTQNKKKVHVHVLVLIWRCEKNAKDPSYSIGGFHKEFTCSWLWFWAWWLLGGNEQLEFY